MQQLYYLIIGNNRDLIAKCLPTLAEFENVNVYILRKYLPSFFVCMDNVIIIDNVQEIKHHIKMVLNFFNQGNDALIALNEMDFKRFMVNQSGSKLFYIDIGWHYCQSNLLYIARQIEQFGNIEVMRPPYDIHQNFTKEEIRNAIILNSEWFFGVKPLIRA